MLAVELANGCCRNCPDVWLDATVSTDRVKMDLLTSVQTLCSFSQGQFLQLVECSQDFAQASTRAQLLCGTDGTIAVDEVPTKVPGIARCQALTLSGPTPISVYTFCAGSCDCTQLRDPVLEKTHFGTSLLRLVQHIIVHEEKADKHVTLRLFRSSKQGMDRAVPSFQQVLQYFAEKGIARIEPHQLKVDPASRDYSAQGSGAQCFIDVYQDASECPEPDAGLAAVRPAAITAPLNAVFLRPSYTPRPPRGPYSMHFRSAISVVHHSEKNRNLMYVVSMPKVFMCCPADPLLMDGPCELPVIVRAVLEVETYAQPYNLRRILLVYLPAYDTKTKFDHVVPQSGERDHSLSIVIVEDIDKFLEGFKQYQSTLITGTPDPLPLAALIQASYHTDLFKSFLHKYPCQLYRRQIATGWVLVVQAPTDDWSAEKVKALLKYADLKSQEHESQFLGLYYSDSGGQSNFFSTKYMSISEHYPYDDNFGYMSETGQPAVGYGLRIIVCDSTHTPTLLPRGRLVKCAIDDHPWLTHALFVCNSGTGIH